MSSTYLTKLQIIQGDITKLTVDVIVNSANKALLGGGGVDGAIHRAAGKGLYEECKTLGGCETGEAKITKAYNIETVKAIIHVVGPIVSNVVRSENRQLLSNCYRNALNLAKENNYRSIAFPCISTGIYSFPNEEAAKIAINTVKQWLSVSTNLSVMDKIIFCVFFDYDLEIYKSLLPELSKDHDSNKPRDENEYIDLEN